MNDLKTSFSEVLAKKYGMNEEEIERFWTNKEKEEQYNNRLFLICTLGFLTITTGFVTSIIANTPEMETSLRFTLQQGSMGAAVIGGALSGSTLLNPNPYKSKDNKELNKTYRKFKRKYQD